MHLPSYDKNQLHSNQEPDRNPIQRGNWLYWKAGFAGRTMNQLGQAKPSFVGREGSGMDPPTFKHLTAIFRMTYIFDQRSVFSKI